jgi:GTP-binding protein
MVEIKNPQFVKSILNWKEKPRPALPEIAFVGRSNVGKSSLINCLVNIKNFARVSKQPGKTQTINFFQIDDAFYLVDLPGYGYAKRSKKQLSEWGKSIEDYLLNSRELAVLYVLIDSKVGVKAVDQQLLEWLRFNHIPFEIVATKVDRIPKSARVKQEKLIKRELNLPDTIPLMFFSAKTRQGRGEMKQHLSKVLSTV